MEVLLSGCSLVFFLWKPSGFTATVIVGLLCFLVYYVFSLITSIILPSSAIYFRILFYNSLAVPKDLFSSNNNCRSNNINHPGATCMHLGTFFAFLITELDGIKQGVLTFFFYLSKENYQIYLFLQKFNSTCHWWVPGTTSLFISCWGSSLRFFIVVR